MIAAVEELSIACKTLIGDLDNAFCSFMAATSSPQSLSRSQRSGLVKGEDNGAKSVQGTVARSIRRSKRLESTPSTRKLRSSGKVESAGPKEEEATPSVKPKKPSKSAAPATKVSSHFPASPLKKSKRPAESPYFKSPKTKSSSSKTSCIPFPPLTSPKFGLVQERLRHDPFRLLIAVTFLNKTRGAVALPVFYTLMARYPTVADLASANQEDVVEIIQHLGLQNQRANRCINLAKAWLERPPEKGKRYRVLHYPEKGDGKDVKPAEILEEDDERVGWEVGQLPGIGAYAIDSWRIFCRDELRGLPHDPPQNPDTHPKKENENSNDTTASQAFEMQGEWTRVLPLDKELRAYLRWRWLRNGWIWNPLTGEKTRASEEQMEVAREGGVICEGESGDVVVGKEAVEDGAMDGMEGVKA